MNLVKSTFAVYLVFAAALSVPRFFEFPGLCNRALECVSLHRFPGGPFRSDFKIYFPKICGDLAQISNRPELCEYRSEKFETDEWGYRNTESTWKSEPETVIWGDSFAYGQGITQSLDPAEQLATQANTLVYSGAGKFELNYLRWLFDHRQKPPKTVIFYHLERHTHRPQDLKDWNEIIHSDSVSEKLKIFNEDLSHYNPAKILAARMDKKFLTPGVFPNRFDTDYPVYELQNGRPILFLPSSVSRYGDPRAADLAVEEKFFLGLQDILKPYDTKLIVALIPEKYTVYAHLLKSPPSQAEGLYMAQLAEKLNQDGLSAVNLLPALKKHADEEFKSGRLIYWTDDTHWNPEGIKIAAREIAKLLPKNLNRPASGFRLSH